MESWWTIPYPGSQPELLEISIKYCVKKVSWIKKTESAIVLKMCFRASDVLKKNTLKFSNCILTATLVQRLQRNHETSAYQGLRNFRFSENLACFVFSKHLFWDSHFCLITFLLHLNSINCDHKHLQLAIEKKPLNKGDVIIAKKRAHLRLYLYLCECRFLEPKMVIQYRKNENNVLFKEVYSFKK